MALTAVLLAGGIGSRMGTTTPKQYLFLKDKPIVLHSFHLLQNVPEIEEIIVVCDPLFNAHFPGAIFAKPGSLRQESLYNAIAHISPKTDLVLTHDAARPLIKIENVIRVIEAGKKYGAATLATPVKVTIKEVDQNLMVIKTLDRSNLYDIQTPQVIKKELLIKGFQKIKKENLTVTDDVSIAELLAHPVKIVTGSPSNIKITTKEDLQLAEKILCEQLESIQV